MRETTVARSYAEALFELGQRHRQLEVYADALDVVTGLLETQPAIRTFLESPTVEPAAKKGVLTDALGNRVPRPFLIFSRISLGVMVLFPMLARGRRHREARALPSIPEMLRPRSRRK